MIPVQQYYICLLVLLKAVSEKGNVACVEMGPLLKKKRSHSPTASQRSTPRDPAINPGALVSQENSLLLSLEGSQFRKSSKYSFRLASQFSPAEDVI